MSTPPFTMPSAAKLGRVALRVGSLNRTLPFYEDVIGLDVAREQSQAVLSAGETSLVVLDEDAEAPVRPTDAAGLFHLAVRVPSREALGDVLARIEGSNIEAATLTGASDHLVSEALYLRDPEGNGVELYRDRPRTAWTVDEGRVEMDTLSLDLDLVRAAGDGGERLPGGTDLGHVHLEVSSLEAARDFYVDTLGLNVRNEAYEGALFVAAGDYHHHVGLNTWNGRSQPVEDHRGLEWFEICVPDSEAVVALQARLGDGTADSDSSERFEVTDPDGVEIRIRHTA